MDKTLTFVSILGGVFVIVAALWRIGTSLIRLIRRADRLMQEHEFLLKSAKDNSAAILKLNRRLDRMAGNNG